MGKNSRLLLGDGTIYWVGPHDDAVRPTGPFDPELPVLAFRRGDGRLEAILFNHSTHTIGTLKPGVRSPSFYGLAAQALEKEKGGTVSSSRGLRARPIISTSRPAEAIYRIQQPSRGARRGRSRRASLACEPAAREMAVKVRRFRRRG